MEAVVPQSSEGTTEYLMDNGPAGGDYFLPSADYNSNVNVLGQLPHGSILDHQLPYDKTLPSEAAGCLLKLPPQPENCDDYASNEVYMDNGSSVDLNEGDNYEMDDYCQDTMEERYTSSKESKPESASERVLCQLDEVLRQKINLELESFRRSLHVMLNDQRSNLQHLVRLASIRTDDDTSEERRIDDVIPLDYENDFQASISGSGSSQSQTEQEKFLGFTDKEEDRDIPNETNSSRSNKATFRFKEEKLLCLIKLQTLASIITNNLRRKEYLT